MLQLIDLSRDEFWRWRWDGGWDDGSDMICKEGQASVVEWYDKDMSRESCAWDDGQKRRLMRE